MTVDDQFRSWVFNSPIQDIEYEKMSVKLVINTYLKSGRGFMCSDFRCKIPQCTLCIVEVGSTDGISAPHLVQQRSNTAGDSEICALGKFTLPNDNMTLLEFLQEGAAINDGATGAGDRVIEVIQFLRKRWEAGKKNAVGRRPFKCPRCSELFHSKGEFWRHHWRTHKMEYPCNRCRFNATTVKMIKTHLKDVHKRKTSKH